jgi:hypothetical protein
VPENAGHPTNANFASAASDELGIENFVRFLFTILAPPTFGGPLRLVASCSRTSPTCLTPAPSEQLLSLGGRGCARQIFRRFYVLCLCALEVQCGGFKPEVIKSSVSV